MTAYATVEDVEKSLTNELTETEKERCGALLERAGVIIDAFNASADADAKKEVSLRMVIRALDSGTGDIPVGASQGSIAALGYSQSWTIGSSGGTGELYLGKQDKDILGYQSAIGSYSPVQDLVRTAG